jgi:hypothetical protein
MANHKKQFCIRGHDTFICGRSKKRMCLDCRKENNRIDPSKNSRIKDFCVNGHEIAVVGRYSNGTCKQCKRVAVRKSIGQFCPKGHDTFVTGRTKSRNCIICEKERRKKYREENKEKIKTLSKKWYASNKERAKISNRAGHLKRKYGLSLEDYNKLLEEQNNKCAGCLRSAKQLKCTFLDVDHDHKTGYVRGLLCRDCNTSLGKLSSNPVILRRLADYLEAFL